MTKSGAASHEDPFAALGLARSFVIAEATIIGAQVRALAKSHPDRQTEGVDREIAIAKSALINGASAILRDPMTRAEALIDLENPMGAAVSLTPTQLVELLERREEVEIMDSQSRRRVAETRHWVQAELSTAFDYLAAQHASHHCDWVKARAAVAYVRALRRLSHEIDRLAEATPLDGAQ
ncbi:MAG: hypothetical protein EXS17_02075 [Phycisphaerales bacterium]|nr:hypothetical protein [Phycisphaerales bacterium]